MPNSEIEIAKVNVMGREFKIRCPKDKTKELTNASDYLNTKMQEVQRGDKFIPVDRIAITAALNITHDLFLEKQSSLIKASDFSRITQKVLNLKHKIDEALEIA